MHTLTTYPNEHVSDIVFTRGIRQTGICPPQRKQITWKRLIRSFCMIRLDGWELMGRVRSFPVL